MRICATLTSDSCTMPSRIKIMHIGGIRAAQQNMLYHFVPTALLFYCFMCTTYVVCITHKAFLPHKLITSSLLRIFFIAVCIALSLALISYFAPATMSTLHATGEQAQFHPQLRPVERNPEVERMMEESEARHQARPKPIHNASQDKDLRDGLIREEEHVCKLPYH